MSEDAYTKLAERLNQNNYRLPLIEPVLALLRHLFTEEQASLGAQIPLGAHTAEVLAGQLGLDEQELTVQLEEMANRGLIFTNRHEDGSIEYSVNPYVPGIIELQFMRGNEGEADRETARLLKAIDDGQEERTRSLYENPEEANKKLRPGLRTLSVEEALPTETTIYPYEQLSGFLDGETSYAAGACTCRQKQKLNQEPCKMEKAPKNTCLYFGKVADYMVDWDFAERLTREQVLALMKSSEEAGLVHNVSNTWGNSIVMCNCCSCCCPFLRNMTTYRGLKSVVRANFIAVADEESCTGCGECIDRCQMAALTLEDGTVSLHQDYCIGCGNCASVCPSGSMRMVRRDETIEPRIKETKVEKLGV